VSWHCTIARRRGLYASATTAAHPSAAPLEHALGFSWPRGSVEPVDGHLLFIKVEKMSPSVLQRHDDALIQVTCEPFYNAPGGLHEVLAFGSVDKVRTLGHTLLCRAETRIGCATWKNVIPLSRIPSQVPRCVVATGKDIRARERGPPGLRGKQTTRHRDSCR
jgi:hypothetical protein